MGMFPSLLFNRRLNDAYLPKNTKGRRLFMSTRVSRSLNILAMADSWQWLPIKHLTSHGRKNMPVCEVVGA